MRDDQTRAFLESCIRRGDPRSTVAATKLLGEYGADAVPALRSALENPLPDQQGAAADALGRIGPAAARAVPRLLDIVRSAPLYDRAAPTRNAEYRNFVAPLAAVAALRRIGAFNSGICTVLIEQIRRGRLEMQAACVWTAGRLGCGDETALDAIRAMTVESGLNPGYERDELPGTHENAEAQRRWAMRRATWMLVLRREGAAAMRRDMIGYFAQDAGQIDGRALEELGDDEGAEEFVPVLVSLLDTRNSSCAGAAAQSLGRMGEKARTAIPHLLSAASTLGPQGKAYPVLLAMNRIGPVGPESTPALRRLRWGPDLDTSLEARRALLLAGAK